MRRRRAGTASGSPTTSCLLQGTSALRWARAQEAASVVLAVPVAPALTAGRLAEEADEIVGLETPHLFHAVGQWYEDFGQVRDERVVELLSRAW